jgi:hypothetical protein
MREAVRQPHELARRGGPHRLIDLQMFRICRHVEPAASRHDEQRDDRALD